ncbi:hypothetical protein C8247_07160 [Paracidovorax avenae]|uniref:hypothetical protein n=1 Tax=Paracidovorax avenae TaxID=80867 RepID=UPI000D1709BF|nr:hypothetical protein [Paracidovorax avenae]AVS70236.1 hypothetical protein C8247_07160 [Paracidovorax avenae]
MRRRLVFFALIVLMALRGLVGPAMAAQMAGVVHAGSTVSAHAEHAAHGTALDETAAHAAHARAHGGHGAASPDSITSTPSCHGEVTTAHARLPTAACGAASGDHAAHAACADCEICHTVVMAPAAPAPGAVSHGGGLRVPAAVRFASALPAQATKPPIS